MEYNDWYRANRSWLCSRTPNLADFMRHLRVIGLLDEDTQAEIENCPGHLRRSEKLYDHLIRFGSPQVGRIIQCLQESDQPHVAERFQEILIDALPEVRPTVSVPVPPPQNPVQPLEIDHNYLRRCYDLIVADDEVIERWSTIVELIVRRAPDRVRIRYLITAQDYEGAILKTLRLWEGYGSERADLLQVLRDNQFHTLADKLAG